MISPLELRLAIAVLALPAKWCTSASEHLALVPDAHEYHIFCLNDVVVEGI
jgi:hypothetical protein